MAKILTVLFLSLLPVCLKCQIDTLEILESDTSIVYIVEEEPVLIRDTVKYFIQPPKLYTRIGSYANFILNQVKYHPLTGQEEYFKLMDAVVQTTGSYGFGMMLWNCPKRISKGLSVDLIKLRQSFRMKRESPLEDIETINGTSLAQLKIGIGYKFHWKKNWDFYPEISSGIQYVFGITGYAYNQYLNNYLSQIHIIYKFKEFHPVFGFQLHSVYSIRKIEVDLIPQFTALPFNVFSQAPVSLKGYFVGLKIGLSHKLF
ncbi:MAG: hypothetical protein MUF42_09805 [Cytophagaceae bacterium]|jgi:hypothetical protein|nr:hypothetical protein [Cytophagaceae bacterium]